MREAIEDLVTSRPEMRVIVTCRSAAYQGQTALGKDFKEIKVLPLSQQHLSNLVKQAYAAIYKVDTQTRQEKSKELLEAIAYLEMERQQRLGKNTPPLIDSPLLVRMLLVVHYSERRLPDQRSELYLKATDAMLLPEYGPDTAVANRIGGLVGGSREVHRELVQYIAFAMYQEGEEQGREISEQDLKNLLQAHPTYAKLMDDFIALTRLRGTLLEERLGMYRFIHLAFQEFMVARYLASKMLAQGGIEAIATFLEAGPLLDSWWREVVLLVASYFSATAPSSAEFFLQRLGALDEQAEQRNQTLSAETQLVAVELSWVAVNEWSNLPPSLKTALAERLVALFEDKPLFSQVPIKRRASVGTVLGQIGDPRPGIITLDEMPFCYIPAGPFWMGSNKNEDAKSRYDEQPRHQVNLAYDYWLARYPITVAQYKRFIEESGHQPKSNRSIEGIANHPVSYITWHEALKFCQWLTEKWHKIGHLAKDLIITLPSEAEWEKAARGGLEIPTQTQINTVNNLKPTKKIKGQDNPSPWRIYPWGGNLTTNEANWYETGIKTVSSVGLFPSGASSYGCLDMSGNVWEWTRSLWGPWDEKKREAKLEYTYPYIFNDGRENLKSDNNILRVLRGGSFSYSVDSLRCAFRGWSSPVSFNDYLGFRVCLRPYF